MGQEWFLTRGGESRYGPYSAAQLQGYAKSGQLQPTDMVWRQGMDKWVPASQVKGLFPNGQVTTSPTVPQPPPLPAMASVQAAEAPQTKPTKWYDTKGFRIGAGVAVASFALLVIVAIFSGSGSKGTITLLPLPEKM